VQHAPAATALMGQMLTCSNLRMQTRTQGHMPGLILTLPGHAGARPAKPRAAFSWRGLLGYLHPVDGNISHTAPEWPYLQVAAKLRQVVAGLGINDPLPSESQLAQRFGVSIKTVRRAVRVLADEGVVYVVPSRGSFKAR
jgi:GntR family transcriptional regulator